MATLSLQCKSCRFRLDKEARTILDLGDITPRLSARLPVVVRVSAPNSSVPVQCQYLLLGKSFGAFTIPPSISQMPSSSASDGIKTYEALSPPKRQKKLTHKRRSVKPRKASLPKLTKSQSTLTQLLSSERSGFSRDAISISSGEEREEPPRKKKRRKTKPKFDEREQDQSSMTQFHRGEWSSSTKRKRQPDLDDDGFQIWADYDPDVWTEGVKERQQGRKRQLPWLQNQDEDTDDEPTLPEIPETSQADHAAPLKHDITAAEDVETKSSELETPRAAHLAEIPSSQTPPSTRRSNRSGVQQLAIQRSPLKERSTNIQVAVLARQSSQSQNISMKMLEKIRFATRQVPLNDTRPHRTEMYLASPDREPVEAARFSPAKPAPTLQRITTIEDSQAEVESDPSDSLAQSPVEDHVKPKRSLKRVSTVQDSQYEELDLDHDDEAKRGMGDTLEEYDDCQSRDDENDFQATFDPVNSALDRDAARFGWTQTQKVLPDVHRDTEEHEADDDDFDHRCAVATTNHAAPETEELFEQSDQLLMPPPQTEFKQLHEHFVKPACTAELARHLLQDDSAYESSDPIHLGKTDAPSSPPALRPSQISTVVPTQMSQRRPLSRESDSLSSSSPPKAYDREPLTLPSSPHQSTWLGTFSSSPLPLPPWSSPETGRFINADMSNEILPLGSDVQLESLVDFSLPPPPPLSSSSRQTPASSST